MRRVGGDGTICACTCERDSHVPLLYHEPSLSGDAHTSPSAGVAQVANMERDGSTHNTRARATTQQQEVDSLQHTLRRMHTRVRALAGRWGFQQRRWRAAERGQPIDRERTGSPTLQPHQDPILLLRWVSSRLTPARVAPGGGLGGGAARGARGAHAAGGARGHAVRRAQRHTPVARAADGGGAGGGGGGWRAWGCAPLQAMPRA
jgi:hypothetical protein